MTTATMPNLSDLGRDLLDVINTMSRDYGIPAADAATIVLKVRSIGFDEGRDTALKAVVGMCDGLIITFNQEAK
ncbi:hypothetical protein ABFB09_02700 [Dehalogenimonas sp. THU2]|uniref:hypothetical protein n=1 Tax=Dehalogenimonas sp. THU2 TaxID=3151121 RepID=UPI0032181622